MVIRFADVTIDADGHEVRRGGDVVDVQPQVLDVLLHLIRHRDRVVSKEELLDAVWEHRFVTESALTSRIKSARQAIGDNGRDQHMIRTVHGRGYRFVAPIDGGEEDSTELATARVPTRLPSPATPFIGREDELGRLTELIRLDGCRIVTITGPGGMGKTRLALEAAGRLGDAFAGGACFVPCASVADADSMVHAVADGIGLSLDAGTSPRAQLISTLASSHALLVLDNLEHLATLDLVTDIATAAPGITVLATSRERLGLYGESTFELGGLGSATTGRATARDDAVTLFEVAARRAKPDVASDERTEDAIRAICRLVDGMPLAIELAAAWSAVLTPDEIRAEIARGLELLETDLRDVPDRHRSIRSVFDAAWARLTEQERRAFMSLSVFRGGFTRAAAAAVADAPLPVLRRLIATSMITSTHGNRFAIHELLRQYGERHLAEAGTIASVRRRHSEHVLAWVAAQRIALGDARQRATIDGLSADLDNVRAAWTDAIADQRLATAGGAIETLWRYFDSSGRVSHMAPFTAAADIGDDAAAAWLGALLDAGRGMVLAHEGELDAGRAALERGLAGLGDVADDAERASHRALVQLWLGWVSFLLARNDDANHHAERALTTFTALSDEWGIARCQVLLGNILTALGQLELAEPPLRSCRAIAAAIGDRRIESMACRNLAILAGWSGHHAPARTLVDHALELSAQLDDRLGRAYALRELGKLQIAEGSYDDAVATLEQSIGITDAIGGRWESAATADDLGNALAARGDLDAAERALTACLDAARASSNRYYTARSLGDLGALALRRGDGERAEQLLHDALALWDAMGHEPYTAWTLLQLGHAASADRARRGEAARHFGMSMELASRHEVAPLALEILVGLVALELVGSSDERESALGMVTLHPAATFEVRRRAAGMLAESGSAPVEAGPASMVAPTADEALWATAARFANLAVGRTQRRRH